MSNKNWSVTLTNLSQKQAEQFASWFEGQGEQQMDEWFDINGVESFTVDVHQKYKTENNNIQVACR